MSGFRNNPIRAIGRHARPLVLIVLLTVFLAMQGGTPFYHPDSLVDRAEKAMANGGNPGFFHYPALMLYLNGVVYEVYESILQAFPEESPDSWPHKDFPGHLLTALFSVIAALSVYGTTYILTRSRLYAVMAALLLIASPLWNADAHYITVDIPLASLCALTLFALVFILESKSAVKIRHIVVLGILIGLTASAKYNGALIASSVMIALLLRVRPWFRKVTLLALCGLIAIATFLLINPFALIEFDAFRRDFMYEVSHVAKGHWGYTVDTAHYHFSVSLYNAWGALLLVLSGLGAVLLLINKEQRLHARLAVLTFSLLHLLVLYKTKLSFQRYALPLIPFLAILAVYAVFQVRRYAKTYLGSYRFRITSLLLAAVLVIALGMNLYQTQRHNILLGRTDTRTVLQEVFSENSHLLKSLRVVAGRYSRLSLRDVVHVGKFKGSAQYDILIVDSFSFDRFLYDKGRTVGLGFSRFLKGRLVTISPFDENKETVPFSDKSIYSPYAPDLSFRTRPGPYIEIYFRDPSIAQHFYESLLRKEVRKAISEVPQGYYFRQFSHAE